MAPLPRPMKIERIICQILRVRSVERKTASSQDVVLVRVRTDDGLEGIGEADASPEVVKAIVDAPFSHNIACGLREILLGEDPLETERLWQKMHRRTQYFGRAAVTVAAMSAIDMALWDLKGKQFGHPVHRLLGGRQHKRLKAYASILFFFFSSRRRHTRSLCDWSSDVCSSDLSRRCSSRPSARTTGRRDVACGG